MPDQPHLAFSLINKRIWVAGHRGMVGSAVVRRLQAEDCIILTAPRDTVDLLKERDVEQWFQEAQPEVVVLAAAKVGGILANYTYPVDFLEKNLIIQTNILKLSHRYNVEKLIFLGSSCIYPKLAPQPIDEESLLTGALEPTNEWYAIAKIAGVKLCQAYRKQYGRDFISAMPTNLYGPGDNFDLNSSHVLPALIRKAHEAKLANKPEMVIWGSGTPRREFLHVDDCADAIIHLLKHYSDTYPINVGSGADVSIFDLASLVASTVGFKGRITLDKSKPDGTPRKLMNVARLSSLGWNASILLGEGVRGTYDWFRSRFASEMALHQ